MSVVEQRDRFGSFILFVCLFVFVVGVVVLFCLVLQKEIVQTSPKLVKVGQKNFRLCGVKHLTMRGDCAPFNVLKIQLDSEA